MNTPSLDRCRLLRTGVVAFTLATLALAPISMASERLANRSFDEPGGAGWSVEPYTSPDPPYTAWAPFAVVGEVDLYRKYPFPEVPPVRMLWQDLNISNVGGASGTASVVLRRGNSNFAENQAISTRVYLDYLDQSSAPQQLLLLSPDNYQVPQDLIGKRFSSSFTLPAGAQKITGLSVYRTWGGYFHAMEFSLDLEPTATLTSPAAGTTFASGAVIPLEARVEPNGASVAGVEFFDGNTPIGTGQRGYYRNGGWWFPDGSHVAVMEGRNGTTNIDVSLPSNGGMYFFNGSLERQTTTEVQYTGVWRHWNGTGMDETSGLALLIFPSDGTLGTYFMGGAFDFVRGGGTQDSPMFTRSWTNATPGSHTLTARVYYGTGQSVTSAPVNITVSAAGGFSNWVIQAGIPEGRRGLTDCNGPLSMQNLTAYAMGLSPLLAVPADLPQVASPNPAAGTLHLIYRRAKNISDASLIPRISTDLNTWSNATVLSHSVVGGGSDWERIDATIGFTPGPAVFLKLAAQTPP